eukprot:6685911-Alexandrium_andersonii.AAC.1
MSAGCRQGCDALLVVHGIVVNCGVWPSLSFCNFHDNATASLLSFAASVPKALTAVWSALSSGACSCK